MEKEGKARGDSSGKSTEVSWPETSAVEKSQSNKCEAVSVGKKVRKSSEPIKKWLKTQNRMEMGR